MNKTKQINKQNPDIYTVLFRQMSCVVMNQNWSFTPLVPGEREPQHPLPYPASAACVWKLGTGKCPRGLKKPQILYFQGKTTKCETNAADAFLSLLRAWDKGLWGAWLGQLSSQGSLAFTHLQGNVGTNNRFYNLAICLNIKRSRTHSFRCTETFASTWQAPLKLQMLQKRRVHVCVGKCNVNPWHKRSHSTQLSGRGCTQVSEAFGAEPLP